MDASIRISLQVTCLQERGVPLFVFENPGRARETDGHEASAVALVEAYSDESGNSGSNLFDPAQPWFWTGTLIARGNIQALAAPLVRDLCGRLGVSELHGNDLGLPRIETFAQDLQAFLESIKARIVFTALEKAHVASTKLVDTVLDSGTNKGVSGLHYGVRGLRVPLAHVIVECMTRQDQEDFWGKSTVHKMGAPFVTYFGGSMPPSAQRCRTPA